MADTGYNHADSWTFVQDADPDDWDATPIGAGVTQTGTTVISNDLKTGTIIGVSAYENNTGDIDGDIIIHILGDTDGTNYEEPGVAGNWQIAFTPVRNATVYKRIFVPGAEYDDFKVAIENQSGQEVAMDVRYKQSSIPLAS